MRWHPAAEDKLKGEEEQKQPMVMDSWYLHHPMLNLSRMALKGDIVAKQLFMDSLDYTIKVARHFKYVWPVFYNMETFKLQPLTNGDWIDYLNISNVVPILSKEDRKLSLAKMLDETEKNIQIEFEKNMSHYEPGRTVNMADYMKKMDQPVIVIPKITEEVKKHLQGSTIDDDQERVDREFMD